VRGTSFACRFPRNPVDFRTARLCIDILVAGEPRHREIIACAIKAESESGVVFVASRENLIWMMSLRNSRQDQADIERLSRETD